MQAGGFEAAAGPEVVVTSPENSCSTRGQPAAPAANASYGLAIELAKPVGKTWIQVSRAHTRPVTSRSGESLRGRACGGERA